MGRVSGNDLPHPTRQRWQPIRAGLVELFQYDAEEFWFRDGRLLLRGNNGTGKSKVLALTLPFLLDADLSPHRVEPDGDRKKRMEWNLLLGGAYPAPERTGYSWLEFGRVNDQGDPEFITIGAGIKAVNQRGVTRNWFFVTNKRIGETLWLVDAARIPLGKDRLAEAVGRSGQVTENAGQYRRAVDEALFGLGEVRYRALVDLLIQLRQPQLSKRPDEVGLSRALTEALPPIPQEIVADVAEAFHSLDEDRDELARLRNASRAIDDFSTHYRAYAQVAVKLHAKGPRDAQAEYERGNVALAGAKRKAEEALAALAAVEGERRDLDDRKVRLIAERDALYVGQLAQAATELEHARVELDTARGQQTEVAGDVDRAEKALKASNERLTAATDATAKASEDLARLLQDVADASHSLGASSAPVRRRLNELDSAVDSVRVAELVAFVGSAGDARVAQIGHLRGLISTWVSSHGDVVHARAEQERAEAVATEAEAGVQSSAQQAAQAGLDFVEQHRTHLLAAAELREEDPGPLAAAIAELELWVETLVGPDPARRYATALHTDVRAQLSTARARVEHRAGGLEERKQELTTWITELESDVVVSPPAPPTRDLAARGDRPGVPLWRVIDFADGISEADRAGIEGALEATGILDAWLMPDGRLLDGQDDAFLVAAGRVTGASLADALTVTLEPSDEVDGELDASVIESVLGSIGLVAGGEVEPPGGDWIGLDGRYAVGPLRGRWQKSAAEYIGEMARLARRRTLLAEAYAELTAVDAQLGGAERELAEIDSRVDVLARELDGLPEDSQLRSAHAAAEAARTYRNTAHAALGEVRSRLAELQKLADEARFEVDDASVDLELPSTTSELAEVERVVVGYSHSVKRIATTATVRRTATQAETSAREGNEAAAAELSRVSGRFEIRRQAVVSAEQRHQTLESAVGADVAGLQRQRQEVADALVSVDTELSSVAKRERRALHESGGAEADVAQFESRAAELGAARRQAASEFQVFTQTGLVQVALPELELMSPSSEWAPDPTVRLARRVDAALDGVADGVADWNRAQRRLGEAFEDLEEVLTAQGNSATRNPLGDVVVVEVVYAGRSTNPRELALVLAQEVADRGKLLSEREREILENYLVDEVASTLQDLIQQAELQVDRMNQELTARPTSTGMRLRLQWVPSDDSPDGFDEARRRILRQKSDAWSAQDREVIGAFLQRRIDQFRAGSQAGTWLEQLRDAFDYRTWNRFVVQIHQNGQWRSASGPASGGERVLAASVPLFAAASAHYSSAGNSLAPRIVTLDEAFAGVDDRARADYLGLLAAFDLDVVMTSEREWACYPQVPGIAIAQLSRAEGVDAVHVARWEWDGLDLRAGSAPELSAIAPRTAPAEPALELEGLE